MRRTGAWAGGPIVAGLISCFLVPGALFAADVVTADTPKRAWGMEQALGEPDTLIAGDIQTAWASLTSDEQREWLIVEFAEPVKPKTLSIHETYNPGAVDKVTVFDPEGKEVVAWEGTDPTPQGSGKGISVIPIKVDFLAKRFKIYVDSPAVSGWNEIDAVGLTSSGGELQWAAKAEASTTYATQTAAEPPFVAVDAARITRLENEMKALKAEVERLKAIEAELKEIKALLKERR